MGLPYSHRLTMRPIRSTASLLTQLGPSVTTLLSSTYVAAKRCGMLWSDLTQRIVEMLRRDEDQLWYIQSRLMYSGAGL